MESAPRLSSLASFRNEKPGFFPSYPDWTFVPRSRFDGKAWIDLPWLGGTRLKYPPPAQLPKTFKDHPDIAGFLVFNPPKSPTGSPMGIGNPTNLYFGMATWKTEDGRETWLADPDGIPFNLEGAYLPHVFGSSPKRFRLSWPSFPVTTGTPNTLDVEIPGNGIPAPALKAVDAKIGPWTAHFRPLPWLGPSFTVDYEVTVDGLPASDLAVLHTSAKPFANLNDFDLASSKPTILSLPEFKPSTVGIRISTNRRTGFNATVARGSSSPLMIKRDQKDIAMVYDSMGLQALISVRPLDNPRNLKIIDGCWLDSPPLKDRDINRLIDEMLRHRKKYTAGQALAGIEYVPIESHRADVKLNLPDPKSYPSAAEFLAKERFKGP